MMGAELLRDVLAKRLAAKPSASNPTLALRGLAAVRQRATATCVVNRVPLLTGHSCNSLCLATLQQAMTAPAGVPGQAGAAAQNAVDLGYRHRPQVRVLMHFKHFGRACCASVELRHLVRLALAEELQQVQCAGSGGECVWQAAPCGGAVCS